MRGRRRQGRRSFASDPHRVSLRGEFAEVIMVRRDRRDGWWAVSIALLESFYDSGKPVALVCHAPGALHRVMHKGEPLVKDKRVTGFANTEEEEVQLTNVMPFLVEDELKRLGGRFEKAPNWQSFVVVDGRLITGQNPASSTDGAQALVKLLDARALAVGL